MRWLIEMHLDGDSRLKDVDSLRKISDSRVRPAEAFHATRNAQQKTKLKKAKSKIQITKKRGRVCSIQTIVEYGGTLFLGHIIQYSV